MDKTYCYEDYFKPTDEEVQLNKDYKATTKKVDKLKIKKKLMELRGIVLQLLTDKNGNTSSCYRLFEKKFTEYLLTAFCVVYISGNIFFYNWKLHLYEYIDSGVYLSFFKKLIDEHVGTLWSKKLENMYHERFLRDIPIKLKEWSVPEDHIVFNNGILKISTGEFIQGDHPELVINRSCTGYDYDPDATCPNFIIFLEDIFNGNQNLIDVMQEMGGYTLCYGSNPLQVIVILVGRGRNGKGVICSIIIKMHGANSCSATSVDRLSTQFGLGEIYDKVLNISNENNENVCSDTSILKTISGNDVVMVEKKYKDPIPTRIFCKLWISTNDISFKDTSKGFEERLVPIPFNNTYVNNPKEGTNQKKRDSNLEKKLEAECSGIFNYFYDGLKRLRANDWKITECEEVDRLREMIVEDSNPVQLFVNTMLVKKEGAKTKKADAYERFKEWAAANSVNTGTYVSAQKFYSKFEAVLSSKGFTPQTKRIQGYDHYVDFLIKAENLT